MRIYLIFVIFLLFNKNYAQDLVPPVLKFEGIRENWVYISKDENFNQFYNNLSNTGFSPYALKNCRDIQLKDDFIFILESTQSPSPFLGYDGFLLHKIDKNTGTKSWLHHNNFMSGNKYRELYWNNKIKFDNLGNIVILGYRDLDTMEYNFPKFSFYGNPIERSINLIGNLVNIKVGNSFSRTKENIARAGNSILSFKRERYYHCFFDLLNSDNYVEELSCYPLTNNFEINKDSFLSVPFSSELANNAVISLEYQKSYVQFSEDTIVTLTLFGTSDKLSSPENAKLSWIVIDSFGMERIKTVDISDDIFRPQDLSTFHQSIEFQLIDEYIILSQIVAVNIPTIDAKFVTWILVYDRNGNLISKPNLIFNKAKKYTSVKILKIKDLKMFVGVQMDDGKLMGSDILELNLLSGENKKIGSIATAKASNYQTGSIAEFKDLENGNAILNIPLEFYDNNDRSTLRYYFSFKMSDLGLISSTQDSEILNNFFILAPNPSSHQFSLKVPDLQSNMKLNLTDQLGRSIFSEDILSTETIIDISSLASGMYFVSLVDASSGRQLGKIQKLVKVD